MASGKRKRDEQSSFWIATTVLPQSGGHPFYLQVNKILDSEGFDEFVEQCCQRFYADKVGRPSLPPAIYFRLLSGGRYAGPFDR